MKLTHLILILLYVHTLKQCEQQQQNRARIEAERLINEDKICRRPFNSDAVEIQ